MPPELLGVRTVFDGGRPCGLWACVPITCWRLLAGALHRDQLQAEIADLGEHAVQGSLVGHLAGDDGHTAWFIGDSHAVEPGAPVLVKAVLDSNLVVHAT